jgi:hypothetical protein
VPSKILKRLFEQGVRRPQGLEGLKVTGWSANAAASIYNASSPGAGVALVEFIQRDFDKTKRLRERRFLYHPGTEN